MKGYFNAFASSVTGGTLDPSLGAVFADKIRYELFGRHVDRYQSDVLINDTDTLTWLPTVGYQNNSLNVGCTTTSGGN